MAFIKRSKNDVKSKNPFSYGGKTKAGEAPKHGVTVEFRDGTKTTLLNPSGKGAKYAEEIRTGVRFTNDMTPKVDESGELLRLTKEQQAYRAGYLDHQKDTNKIFKKANPNYKRKTR